MKRQFTHASNWTVIEQNYVQFICSQGQGVPNWPSYQSIQSYYGDSQHLPCLWAPSQHSWLLQLDLWTSWPHRKWAVHADCLCNIPVLVHQADWSPGFSVLHSAGEVQPGIKTLSVVIMTSFIQVLETLKPSKPQKEFLKMSMSTQVFRCPNNCFQA